MQAIPHMALKRVLLNGEGWIDPGGNPCGKTGKTGSKTMRTMRGQMAAGLSFCLENFSFRSNCKTRKASQRRENSNLKP